MYRKVTCPTQKFEIVNIKGLMQNSSFVYNCNFIMILSEKILCRFIQPAIMATNIIQGLVFIGSPVNSQIKPEDYSRNSLEVD